MWSGICKDTRCSATAWAAIFSFVRTISWRLGSETNSPARRAAAERVLPAPNTPLIANPVRPSHKANTIALKVARTCPSSSLRSGKRAACNALCSSFSQQTVSIPIANLSSLRAAVKSLRRWRGPLGCKLSAHWIPQHNLSLSRDMRRKTSSSWALLVSQCDRCFGTQWNAWNRTPVPASGARLHTEDRSACPRQHGSKCEPTVRWPFFFAAAWVDPGRSALQSAEQWRKGRYGRIHQVGKMSFYNKNVGKGQ